ncbi:beta-ketoacyl synthase N-terminal-like domain-containing protein [Streptomyces sp. TRM 70351]|uniref:beta-ketoacyl synthase N-terminal-like domain-containing protein n=1 Tax=Streptomyces sp. TRM 70351 TaxID=3116552 RepID=UPI002E7BF6B2|nr:beta-ketoacyl synthase N-terminal-like domain-containing protein [Streptomyces sp. TRM 70351]MEE1930818.1 beta-ketoacyl synthase N-terminal-like domain-containing protein [Streptomyces sp. TRM 70351]
MTAHPGGDIAVVGIGCRFPGAHGPRQLWDLLMSTAATVRTPPSDRYGLDSLGQPVRGTDQEVPRGASLLDEVDGFDANFFGIGTREALRMDPQQRIVLETVWEALEDAGIPPHTLTGSRAAVYAGQIWSHYGDLLARDNTPDAYALMGSWVRGMLSGRVSYTLDLRGPSLTLDSGCSSGLATVHLAARALREGEADLALAAGSQILLHDQEHTAFARIGALSPDGCSKFADAAADGFGRGEGCAVVVLKPVSAAVENGDRIYAVVQGSALNNDGRASGSLMVPAVETQVELIRHACRTAGISAADLHFVEAHGVGTPVGDPVETTALSTVLNEAGRRCPPVWLSSMKGNVGHNESVAGLANLIKASLALHHRVLPATPHHANPSTAIDWDALPVRVPTTPINLTPTGTLYAGVSAFSATGSNAHLVLSSPPAHTAPAAPSAPTPYVLPVSARHPDSLRRLLHAYATFVERHPELPLRDVCYTATVRRSHHPWRTAVTFTDHPTAARALRHAADHLPLSPCAAAPSITFVYPAENPTTEDWHALSEAHPHIDRLLTECVQEVEELTGRPWSLSDDAEKTTAHLRWAVYTATTRLWRHWGVAPAAVAAAPGTQAAAQYAAGLTTRQDSLRRLTDDTRLPSAPGDDHPPYHLVESSALDETNADHAGDTHPSASSTDFRLFLGFRPAVTDASAVTPPETDRPAPAHALMEAVSTLYTLGFPLKWAEIVPAGCIVTLPTYRWHRTRYWAPTTGGPPQHRHPLLTNRAVERRSVAWTAPWAAPQYSTDRATGVAPLAHLSLLELTATCSLRAAGYEPVELTNITTGPGPWPSPAHVFVRATSGRHGQWHLTCHLNATDDVPDGTRPTITAQVELSPRSSRGTRTPSTSGPSHGHPTVHAPTLPLPVDHPASHLYRITVLATEEDDTAWDITVSSQAGGRDQDWVGRAFDPQLTDFLHQAALSACARLHTCPPIVTALKLYAPLGPGPLRYLLRLPSSATPPNAPMTVDITAYDNTGRLLHTLTSTLG